MMDGVLTTSPTVGFSTRREERASGDDREEGGEELGELFGPERQLPEQGAAPERVGAMARMAGSNKEVNELA